MNRHFSLSAWGPSANFDLLRLNFDWLRDPGCCYFSVTACLFGFGVCVTFHPYIEPDPKDFDFDAWMATTSVYVPTPKYDVLKADAEAWLAMRDAETNAYFAGFGPNVPVEDLGGKPVGMEKAP